MARTYKIRIVWFDLGAGGLVVVSSSKREIFLGNMGQSEQGEDFPNNDQSFTSNITSINSKQYGNANAHATAIELLEITIKTFKTAQSRNEVIDPISQITTIFANPITTTPGRSLCTP
jgi:hypothetical protein